MTCVRPCAQVSGMRLCLHSLNVGWFLAAAGYFDMQLRFARVEPGRAAHTVAMGVAWRVWWYRCEQCMPARSLRAVLLAPLLTRRPLAARLRRSSPPRRSLRQRSASHASGRRSLKYAFDRHRQTETEIAWV